MSGIRLPYLLFLGDERNDSNAKTAFGVRQWRPEACIAQWSLPGGTVDIGLPRLTPAEAVAQGARSMLIGIAPVGGKISPQWITPICAAIEAGLDIVSGMHTRLGSVDAIREAAARCGRTLHDVRHSEVRFPVGTGARRSGKRLLTVGTDCALGKKYTALALTRAFQAAGHAATFRATGQTGILISGAGVAIDAVVADFIAGAAEWLSPANAPEHWDLIEGQGSLLHPSYAGVSLGLLHGSQPDALVLCHDPARLHIEDHPDFPIPPLEEVMDLHLRHARRVNPAARFVGIALNTSKMTQADAAALLEATARRHGLPAVDPLRSDLTPVVRLATT
ncbi:MAG: DUF1611 domain-containing protein [Gammaproteobacteria bacterium]